MGCTACCGHKYDVTVVYGQNKFEIKDLKGGYASIVREIKAKYSDLKSTPFKITSEESKRSTIIDNDTILRQKLTANKGKLTVNVTMMKDLVSKHLKDLSYAVVKLVNKYKKRTEATGILLGDKYVLTTYTGKGKIQNSSELADYSIVTRDSTSSRTVNKKSTTYEPKTAGIFLFFPEAHVAIFELTRNVERKSFKLQDRNPRALNGVIMYYKSDTTILTAKENLQINDLDDHYDHEGDFSSNDGSEGAPIFMNFGGNDWGLGGVRFEARSKPMGAKDFGNEAIKASKIIELLRNFERTSGNAEHGRAIKNIIYQAPADPTPPPPQREPSPPASPLRPVSHPPKPTISFENRVGFINHHGITLYEVGDTAKHSYRSNFGSNDGSCVTVTPIGVIVTGGEQATTALLWDGHEVHDLPPSNHPHSDHCAILVGDELYVISGSQTEQVESFDLNSRQWIGKGYLSGPIKNATASFVDNHIVVLGGQDKQGRFLDTVEAQRGDEWVVLQGIQLPNIAFAGAMPISDNKIVLFGGRGQNEGKGDRKNTYRINFDKKRTKDGKDLTIGGDFNSYQPSVHNDEAVIFNGDGELVKFSFDRKKYYRLCVSERPN